MYNVSLAFLKVPVPDTWGEALSLWAIRLSLSLLVVGIGLELTGKKPTEIAVATIWLLGAIGATAHSLGALLTFHHGNHAEALQSTGEQTKELLGFSFAAGLYFNYIFVVVWLVDSVARIMARTHYEGLPQPLRMVVIGFLIFIAFNSAVVFQHGPIRWIGISCAMTLAFLIGRRMVRHSKLDQPTNPG